MSRLGEILIQSAIVSPKRGKAVVASLVAAVWGHLAIVAAEDDVDRDAKSTKLAILIKFPKII